MRLKLNKKPKGFLGSPLSRPDGDPPQPSFIAIDTETTGLNVYRGDRPFFISISDGTNNKGWRAGRINGLTREVVWGDLTGIKEILENEKIKKVFHNTSFDFLMLKSIGINVKGKIFDTIIMSHIDDSSRRVALKPLCKSLFNYPIDDEAELQKDTIKARRVAKKEGYFLGEDVKEDYWLADPKLLQRYALSDAERTAKLFEYFYEQYKIDPIYKKLVDMEMEVLFTAMRMQEVGTAIDLDRLEELKKYYKNKIKEGEREKENLGYADLNPRSNKQMKEVFYDKLNAPKVFRRRKKSNGVVEQTLTCDSDTLEKWAKKYPLAKVLVDIKTASHALSNFIEPFDLLNVNGVLHPNYKTVGPITGRLSCTNPNLQNVSNTGTKHGDVELRIRELIIPRPGKVLYFADYSQIEVWLTAFISDDKTMKDALVSGRDIHGEFSDRFFSGKKDYKKNKTKYRKKTKNGTFCVIYGGGASQLQLTLGISYEDAAYFRNEFFEHYRGLSDYYTALIETAEQLGYIMDPFGRTYKTPIGSEYKGVNYIIQGSAAGVMKRALINVDKMLKNWPGCNLLLTIHDELVVEVPEKLSGQLIEQDIIKAMQGDFHTYFKMPKPFSVSLAISSERWSSKNEIEAKA